MGTQQWDLMMWFQFFSANESRSKVQLKSTKRLYAVEVEFQNGLTRTVKVKASSKDQAEIKALKRHPSAKGVKRDAV